MSSAMLKLAVTGAEMTLDHLREGFEVAKAMHEANPSPENAETVEKIRLGIETLEDRIAALKAVPQPAVSRVPDVTRSQHREPTDPVKEAADRAERRSAEMRAKGRSAL